MADIYDISKRFRVRVLALMEDQSRQMIAEWRAVSERLTAQAVSIGERIDAAIASGKIEAPGPETFTTFSPAWRMEEQRLQALVVRANDEAERLARSIGDEQFRTLARAARMGVDLGTAQLGSLLADFQKMPRTAVEALVGNLQGGSPLKDLFASFGPENAARVRQGLVEGIARGANPVDMAREIRDAVTGTATRSILIARTETMRAFRQGSLATYQQNSDVVQGWLWLCALNSRTCSACWGRHGEVYSLDELVSDHPNGRCTTVPVTSFALPIPDREDAFKAMTQADQRQVLGRSGQEAWARGDVSLSDFSKVSVDPAWGTSVRKASLRELGIGGPVRPRLPVPEPKPVGKLASTVEIEDAPTLAAAQAKAVELLPDADFVDYDKWDLDTANAFNRELASLVADYPQVAARLKSFGSLQSIYKRLFTRVRSRFNPRTGAIVERKITKRVSGRLYGEAHKIYGYLGVNDKWAKNAGLFRKSVLDDIMAGFHPPIAGTSKFPSVLTHEFGHHLDFLLDGHPTFLADVSTALKGVSGGNQIAAGLSRYATKNKREFIAEAFAEYRGSKSPRPIAKAVGRVIEKALQTMPTDAQKAARIAKKLTGS
jgi:SPP1 gp7 family putative phage head morphogenesis protein